MNRYDVLFMCADHKMRGLIVLIFDNSWQFPEADADPDIVVLVQQFSVISEMIHNHQFLKIFP